jgi:hypothetical protein
MRRIHWRQNGAPGAQSAQAEQTPVQHSPDHTSAPATTLSQATPRPLRHGTGATLPPKPALGLPGMEVRCLMWLLAVLLFDFPPRLTGALLVAFCALDLWFLSRLAPAGESLRWVVSHVAGRLKRVPPQVWLFVVIMLLNLALEHILVEQIARPYLFNNLMLNGILLAWACLTTPDSRAARVALHRWATVIICALAALLLVQLVLYNGIGFALDIRQMLTGEASRSGVEEGSEGERPTTIFVEPSCLAIIAFGLTLITRLTGPRHTWLTLVAALTCLLNNSGIGLFLAGYLFAEEALGQLKKHLILAPLLAAVIVSVLWLAVETDVTDFKLTALEQILRPTTRYDPVAMRMYVPMRILNFDSWDHLVGLGIANFAAFKDGFTQYDSSFLLGVYFQTGLLGMPMLVLTLIATWRVHSLRAALMMATLFATKVSLSCTLFWALVCLTNNSKAVCPPHASKRHQRTLAPLWASVVTTWRGAVAATGIGASVTSTNPTTTCVATSGSCPRQLAQSRWKRFASRMVQPNTQRNSPSPTTNA